MRMGSLGYFCSERKVRVCQHLALFSRQQNFLCIVNVLETSIQTADTTKVWNREEIKCRNRSLGYKSNLIK